MKMGGLERAPQAPRARRAPGDPGHASILRAVGRCDATPQAPRARRAPGVLTRLDYALPVGAGASDPISSIDTRATV
jgi:hypothetical protein